MRHHALTALLLLGSLMSGSIALVQPERSPEALLVRDPDHDALPHVDIGSVYATLPDPRTLNITLVRQTTPARGTYTGVPPTFAFLVQFHLAAQEGPVTVALYGATQNTFGGPTWTYWAGARNSTTTHPPTAERTDWRSLGWTTISAPAASNGPRTTWSIDLARLSRTFTRLPAEEPWMLTNPFAIGRVITDPVVEGTLAWAVDSAHDPARRDRAPDARYGYAYCIPRFGSASPEHPTVRTCGTLVHDADPDFPFPATDIISVTAATQGVDALEVTLTRAAPLPPPHGNAPPHYDFLVAFQLSAGTRDVTIGLITRATNNDTASPPRYGGALPGPLPSHPELERIGAAFVDWTPLTTTSYEPSPVSIRWTIDLPALAKDLSLDPTQAWILSNPFAVSRIVTDPFAEAVLETTIRSPQDNARKDRAPDQGYGTTMTIPALPEETDDTAPPSPPGPPGPNFTSPPEGPPPPNPAMPPPMIPNVGPVAVFLVFVGLIAWTRRRPVS